MNPKARSMKVMKEEKEIKFGTEEFFVNYLTNQIKKEDGNKVEIVQRVHYAMTNVIVDSAVQSNPTDRLKRLRVLHKACEKVLTDKGI